MSGAPSLPGAVGTFTSKIAPMWTHTNKGASKAPLFAAQETEPRH